VLSPSGVPSWWLGHIGGRFDALLFWHGRDEDSAQQLLSALDAIRRGAGPGRPVAIHVALPPGSAFAPQLAERLDGRRLIDVKVLLDHQGLLQQRYDGRHRTLYLLRPDQHVCARWRAFDAAGFDAALARACGLDPATAIPPSVREGAPA
jgi:3-(3-hydroxy-phenyl)propionate hydroxylase